MSVYTHPSPTIIFSPADQGTFSKTTGQSQAHYNTLNWERGKYDVNHLQILTCEVAVSTVGSVGSALCSPRSMSPQSPYIFPQVYVPQTSLHMIPQVYAPSPPPPCLCPTTTLLSPLLPQIIIESPTTLCGATYNLV